MTTPRERIAAAFAHKETDRLPIDIGGTIVTSMAKAAYIPLRAHLGLPEEDVKVLDMIQQLPYLSEDVIQRLGGDVRFVALPAEQQPKPDLVDEDRYWGWTDPWGSKLRMPKSNGLYFDWVGFPLADLTDDALDHYQWPAMPTAADLAAIREQALTLRSTTDYALACTSNISGGGIFEQACRLVGTEQFMMAMLTDTSVAQRLLNEIADFYVEAIGLHLDAYGDLLDIVQYGDDLAGQQSWLIHPDTYASMVKPCQKRMFDAVKAKTSAKIVFHSCGAVFDVIPHLIEIGIDALNPIQVSAKGMDTKRLKATYGKDLVFWGGGVDTQRVLPFGNEDEVRAETLGRIQDLCRDGGFVWASVHNIQAQVPPANILAAFDTARTWSYSSTPARAGA